jgi:hypothetical protein
LPRKTKSLPTNRSEWSFGCLAIWHFFVYGTRPDGDPANKVGRPRAPQKAAHALGISVRQLWNWVDDDHVPYDTVALERELFGTSGRFDDQRIELQAALRKTHAQNTAKASVAKTRSWNLPPAANVPKPVASDDRRDPPGLPAKPLTEEERRAAEERRIQCNTVTGQSIGYVLTPTIAECAIACTKDNCDPFAYRAYDAISSQSKGRTCYRYKAPLSFSANASYASGQRITEQDVQPTRNTQRAENSGGLVLTRPNATPPATPNEPVQCATGPVKVTGFTVTCDRILSGGTTLGSAQLSYTVANINECAARCRPISRWVASHSTPWILLDGRPACCSAQRRRGERQAAGLWGHGRKCLFGLGNQHRQIPTEGRALDATS